MDWLNWSIAYSHSPSRGLEKESAKGTEVILFFFKDLQITNYGLGICLSEWVQASYVSAPDLNHQPWRKINEHKVSKKSPTIMLS